MKVRTEAEFLKFVEEVWQRPGNRYQNGCMAVNYTGDGNVWFYKLVHSAHDPAIVEVASSFSMPETYAKHWASEIVNNLSHVPDFKAEWND